MRMTIYGIEGLPGSGKTTLLKQLPRMQIIPEISKEVGGEENFPQIISDAKVKYGISLKSLRINQRFFIDKEVQRFERVFLKKCDLVIFDRTYISQITFEFALVKCLHLPKNILESTINTLAQEVMYKRLYFPDLVIHLQIPLKIAYEKVIKRDGKFFSDNLVEILSRRQQQQFFFHRTNAYDEILNNRNLNVLKVPYELNLNQKKKLLKNIKPAPKLYPEKFFKTMKTRLLSLT